MIIDHLSPPAQRPNSLPELFRQGSSDCDGDQSIIWAGQLFGVKLELSCRLGAGPGSTRGNTRKPVFVNVGPVPLIFGSTKDDAPAMGAREVSDNAPQIHLFARLSVPLDRVLEEKVVSSIRNYRLHRRE